jgi:hypothetical protein
MAFVIIESCREFPSRRLGLKILTRARAWAFVNDILIPMNLLGGPKMTYEIVEIPDPPPLTPPLVRLTS